MASFNYVLVTEENFQKLGTTAFRRQVKGDYYLLNQKDFSGVVGDTLWEKVQPYSGMIVSEAEAQQLLAGTLTPPPIQKDEETYEVINQMASMVEEPLSETDTQTVPEPSQVPIEKRRKRSKKEKTEEEEV